MAETLGASFKIDVTDLKAGLAQANRAIRESESEFKKSAAGLDDWRKSEDGLEAKIKSLNQIQGIQKEKVKRLSEEYDKLIADGLDPASAYATKLRTDINNETAALKKNEAEAGKLAKQLADMKNESKDAAEATEDAGKSAEKASDGFTVMKGAAAQLVANGITALANAAVDLVKNFFGLAESTREARTNMAKLETSFESAGLSARQAEKTYNELYSVFGDDGKATEAAQQLAKISKNGKDLATNTRILTGVMAEYGDSIPSEGLAEGMAATAAMSSVQGVLADALEWQGVNLDEYNKQLEKLKTEEERTAYIQSTLIDLYGESADAYRENNAEVIAAQKAQAELNAALNDMGAIVEPIMTTLKQMAADLLVLITPFVSLLGDGLAGALSGAEDAADNLAAGLNGLIFTALAKIMEMLPVIIDTVLAMLPVLLEKLLAQLPLILQTLLSMVVQVAQSLASMLPTLIPVIIDSVLMITETLLDNIDLIIDAGIALLIGLADGLIAALPNLIEKAPVIIDKLITAITRNLPKILRAGVDLIVKLGAGLIEALPQLGEKVPLIIGSILTGLKQGLTDIAKMGGELVTGIWKGINDKSGWIIEKIKGFGENVLKGLKDFFGIKSPSRVMADVVGKNLALGIGKGFEDNIAGVNDTITGAMNIGSPASGAAAKNVGGVGGVTVYQTNNYSQAHSRIELYKTKQATAAAVRLAMAGA